MTTPVSRKPGNAASPSGRDAALERLGLNETGVLPEFQRLTRIASRLLDAPVSLVSFVASDRQLFKGRHGELPEPFREQTPLSHSFCQHVVSSGTALVIEDARLDPRLSDNQAIEELGVVAYAGWPVVDPAGVVLGSMCAIDSTPRTWSAEQLEVLKDLAEIASAEIGLRLSTARAEQARSDAEEALIRERTLSALLQRSLLPQVELASSRVSIGSHYQPAAGIIGGDFIDSFVIGTGAIGLVVGDIVGKGLGAAAVALELRGEMRRLAIADPHPAAVLAGLNRLPERKPGLFGASLLFGFVELDAARFTWISAGHPAPLVRSAGTTAFLEHTGGMLIGIHPLERPWSAHQVQLDPGATIVIFTDGLLDVPGADSEARPERLRELIASGPEDPQRLCEHVAATMVGSGQRDDVAILALRLS